MLREFAIWILDFANMAREVREHRDTIRDLQKRVRDLEEMLKLSVLEARLLRELQRPEREKLSRSERKSDMKSLPPAKPRRRKPGS